MDAASSRLGAQRVADATNRLEQTRLSLRIDLPPQVADVDVDDVALRVEVHAPHVLGDHGAAQDASGVAHEVLEQGMLARGQGDAAASPADRAGGRVQGEI